MALLKFTEPGSIEPTKLGEALLCSHLHHLELTGARWIAGLPLSWFDKLFIAPRSVSYHLPHHLFVSVPSRNLSKLHAALLKEETYLAQARITKGFNGLFGEFP